MRKYTEYEAITTLVKMGMATTYDRMRKHLIMYNLKARDMLKDALKNKDHYWLQRGGLPK